MNVNISTTKTITISNLERLDNITLYLYSATPSQGKLTIECYGQAWSTFFAGVPLGGFEKFLQECPVSYLADRLIVNKEYVVDYDVFFASVIDALKQKRKQGLEIELPDDWDEVLNDIYTTESGCNNDESADEWISLYTDNLNEIFLGVNDNWLEDISTKPSKEYEYLEAIIKQIQEGIRTLIK